MKTHWYVLTSGKLVAKPKPPKWPSRRVASLPISWVDIQEWTPEELGRFLAPLDLHPQQLSRCLDAADTPGILSFGSTSLMEFPAAFVAGSSQPAYLTVIIRPRLLITARHGPMPALDALVHRLMADKSPAIAHLSQLLYLILDEFADLNVEAQITIRDRLVELSKAMAEKPKSVSAADLSRVRWEVENLVSLVEDQLYCVSNLTASDNPALRDPHQKAFIQDLASELEIAQRGVYRLEARVNDLHSDYQVAGNDLVERRLRLLTIVSAITLPLGLIAGLLGMNVGGLPGIGVPVGFLVVVVLMAVIVALEYWYLRRRGWFS